MDGMERRGGGGGQDGGRKQEKKGACKGAWRRTESGGLFLITTDHASLIMSGPVPSAKTSPHPNPMPYLGKVGKVGSASPSDDDIPDSSCSLLCHDRFPPRDHLRERGKGLDKCKKCSDVRGSKVSDLLGKKVFQHKQEEDVTYIVSIRGDRGGRH